ncbi:hypothetical protein E6P09_10370 [Haloferax mediterranei ATCC 33500]|uniref:30S ribosomal protein S1 n=1 Tax=Haloferax mediterranei (strain ATCC 33500 / DSM 1411 / JCM 8866 / NBRC 14739 / NCIMB 2177 / R-4) TaxID=523841 RepID=I3R4L7_HALMT|nr:hypothetical protein [Haloferax mediterranei]AFK19177.1 hypothetical protein HFX_1469 [Haloferax mediterranei ATCC 33500]AHZ21460.1 30S ribosomal protein S1 [Haloferax mediterranei ATCC 33500]EMA03920.1 hypothetical protein C439_03143 [Haloferax mediterranei ATCC 33500]MDX5989276.1 hypothetical protein [Haloferax mediterranei ATCC 33500]QCQ75647.1 hypothetical protein E6P09_10370 [Haloferax mediterranei ATCC 33500]
MSRLDKLLAGWTFRTATPEFEADEVITAFVSERNGSGLSIRVGDSTIRVADGKDAAVEDKVRLKVTSFDTDSHVGTGELVEVLGPEG